ncbi:MAG: chorismate synthase, partial [Lacrimispora sphenoides]
AKQKMAEEDSIGGVIECVVKNMVPGIGEPVFEKLDANLAKAIMSIGAIKGFEIGSGFEAAKSSGSINNDNFRYDEQGNVYKESNNAGGILGGISDGSDIIFRAAVKPTPSIAMAQNAINKQGENVEISVKGRHDPMIVPRAVVVVEAMTALTLVDMIFTAMTSKIDDVVDFYNRKY